MTLWPGQCGDMPIRWRAKEKAGSSQSPEKTKVWKWDQGYCFRELCFSTLENKQKIWAWYIKAKDREQQFSSGIVLGGRRSMIHKKTRRIRVNSLSCQGQIFRNHVIQMSETSWKISSRISRYTKLYWSGVDLILSRTQTVPSKVHLLARLTAHLALTYTVHH